MNDASQDPPRTSLFRDRMRGPESAALYATIWSLAWPALFAQGVRSMVMLFTRAMVSNLGEAAFNSIGIGMRVFMVIITVITAVAVGTTALVAQSWGAGERAKAGRTLQQSVLWGLVLSIAIAVMGMPLSMLLFYLLGADAKTVELGHSFMFWLFLATPFIAPGFFLAAGLRAAGDTRTPMVGGFIMAGMSLLLTYGLVLGKLGMPELGAMGAALAIGGSFASFTLFLAVRFVSNKTVLKLPLRGWRLNVKTGADMFRIGIPAALQMILVQLGMLIYLFVIFKYGPAPFAGYLTGIVILIFAQSPCHGFQVASATLVGQAVGAGDFKRAESVFRRAALMSAAFMVAVGALVYVLSITPLLPMLFKLSPESIGHTRSFITIIVFGLPLMGVVFSMTGGLRGAGDTVPPLVGAAAGMYGGRIVAAFGLVAVFHPPVAVIWCSMFPDMILRIAVMSARLRSGKWKRSKV